jgi:hypothetical protein
MNSESLRNRRLVLEITLVLIVKLAALAMIWHVWFSDPDARRIDAERVGARMYSSIRAAGPSQGANYSPFGGSAAASLATGAASVGDSSPAMQ